MEVSKSAVKVVFFGTFLIIALFTLAIWKDDHRSPVATSCDTDDENAVLAAEVVLHEWQNGDSGASRWAGDSEKKRLFNVSDFERLDPKYDVPSNPHASVYAFRVKSTTQGGLPITQTWNIYVKQEGSSCKVYDIKEAE